MSADDEAKPRPARVFRLSWLAYVVVLFLFVGVLPLAFADDLQSGGAQATFGPRVLFLVVPVAAAFFIARTATVVNAYGLRVRALFGARTLSWDEVRGLSIDGRSVYAVVDGGAVRLPCVHVANLAELSAASGGRLPEIEAPKPKYAPSRRRR
jgi:hypothetical protein